LLKASLSGDKSLSATSANISLTGFTVEDELYDEFEDIKLSPKSISSEGTISIISLSSVGKISSALLLPLFLPQILSTNDRKLNEELYLSALLQLMI
jgi:hypothetical protein